MNHKLQTFTTNEDRSSNSTNNPGIPLKTEVDAVISANVSTVFIIAQVFPKLCTATQTKLKQVVWQKPEIGDLRRLKSHDLTCVRIESQI